MLNSGVLQRPADLLFGFFAVGAAIVLLWSGRDLTFFFDEWKLVLDPSPLSLSTIFQAHNDQAFVVPSLVYGFGLEVFGLTSQLPYRLVTVVAATTTSVLLYLLVRRHIPASLALVLVLPALFLGYAWEALLLGLSMNFQIGMAAGMGMLLALDQRTRRGDVTASLLLLVALACGGVGLAFAAGAVIEVAMRKNARRAWIPGVPLGLFLLWFFLQSGEASGINLAENVSNLPDYLWRASGAAIETASGSFGLSIMNRPGHLLFPTLIAVLIGITVWRTARGSGEVPAVLPACAGALLGFWILGGLAMGEGRVPEASRYQYPAVILLIGWVGLLLGGMPTPRWLPFAILPLSLVSIAFNLVELRDGRTFLKGQTEITRASLGQVELEGPGPAFTLTEEVTGSPYQRMIRSDVYLDAVKRFGSPAFNAGQIESAGPPGQQAAAGVAMAAAIAWARQQESDQTEP
jgi:hypothetical protein